jgi:hypothetical protein
MSDQPAYDFHQLAEIFPKMEGDELRELADDIRARGLIELITLHEGKILDGRNRYRAAMMAEHKFTPENFRTLPSGVDPQDYVISINIRRRHLTPELKRDLIAKLVKQDPSKSNRQIAQTVNASHHTVGEVRDALETTGQIAQLEATTGKDGKKRGRKKNPKGEKKKSGKETITYSEVVDAITAYRAYQLFEHHLLDALAELRALSPADHDVEEYVRGTIEKLENRVAQLETEEEPEAEEEAA